ncbi:MAG: flagellar basal-body MS-ring/collar protein FliF [Acidobacteriota bacterium]
MLTSFTQFTEIWRRLTLTQRLVIVSAAIVTLALIVALVSYGMQPEYNVLFSDLKPADAQSIVEKLKASNIQYQLSHGGSTISVPSEQVNELRLQMAATGALSARHVGFDLFDKASFGATEFTQKVNYQRALEGELARTLESMEEVESARVHITQARESIFAEKAEPAKASIMLALKGTGLPPERNEVIVNLVASAVEGLAPENVSVMDTRGRLLAGTQQNKAKSGINAFGSLMETKQKLETEVAGRIVDLLEPIAGVGNVRAKVSAELDLNQVEQTEEKFDPKSAVIRTQQISQEVKNGAVGVGGVAGTRANDPALPQELITTGENQPGNGRAASSTAYEIDKTTRHTIGNSGRLLRLSVSVLLDSGATPPNNPEDTKKIQELVVAAAGIDTTRGDQIAVQMIPFQRLAPPTPTLSWYERNREVVKLAIKYGVLGLVALALIFFVVRPAQRLLRPATVTSINQARLSVANSVPLAQLPPATNIEENTGPKTVAEMEAQLTAGSTDSAKAVEKAKPAIPMTPPSLPEPVAEVPIELPPLTETEANAMRKQIVWYTKREPAMVAKTIRNWLHEK